MATKNSFSLIFTVLFTETIHKEAINVYKMINNIDIPSIPTL